MQVVYDQRDLAVYYIGPAFSGVDSIFGEGAVELMMGVPPDMIVRDFNGTIPDDFVQGAHEFRLLAADSDDLIYVDSARYTPAKLDAMVKDDIQNLADAYGFAGVDQTAQTKDEMIAAFGAAA